MQISDEVVDGGDFFFLSVCSPKWLEDHVLRPGPLNPTCERQRNAEFGRHYLFVDELDEEWIRSAVESVVARAEGEDWTDIAVYLARYFRWEYEDHVDRH